MPSEVSAYGITTAKKSAETIMYFALHSPDGTFDTMFLTSYAMTNFLDACKRVKGVSSIDILVRNTQCAYGCSQINGSVGCDRR